MKHVTKVKGRGRRHWYKYNGKYRAQIIRLEPSINWRAYFDTEREAAIAVDKKLIEIGEEPVNILVRK